MILAALGGLWLNRRKKLENSKWYLRIMIALISFPFLANSAGWIMTEIGRQPWTVMGLMTTAQSVSPNVTAGSLLFSIIAFGVMYMILGALLVFLFIREIKKGAEHSDHHDVPVSTDPFSQEVYHGISS